MPAHPSTTCVPYLKALADQSRWSIVRELLGEELTVGGLVDRLKISQYNISKHLRILREAGIVETKKNGKFVHASITSGFRTRLSADRKTLNLGCCTFHFDKE
jgi:DNA-binding transcriptional ArsR family regulator